MIHTADITTDASFFPVEVNGTRMEVIAVKDSEGNIRTAFNTCQVCYDSGRGYYVQSGDYLVCQMKKANIRDGRLSHENNSESDF